MDSNKFLSLDMTGVQDFPHVLPDVVNTWLPKFFGNNGVSSKENLNSFYSFLGLFNVNYEHQDAMMRLVYYSLVKDVRLWYNSLPCKSIKTWEILKNVLLKNGELRKMAPFFSHNFFISQREIKSMLVNSLQDLTF